MQMTLRCPRPSSFRSLANPLEGYAERHLSARIGAKALQLIPDLHFELVSVLVGVGSVTIYYKGAGGRLAAEVFFFDANQKVSRAVAHYGV